MITLCDLLQLLRNGVDLCPWVVEGAPAHVVGAVAALATDPAAAELLEEAELVGTLGLGVDGRCVCGVVAGRGDASGPVEMSGHAVVVGDRGVLARVPFGMANAHVGGKQDRKPRADAGCCLEDDSRWRCRGMRMLTGTNTPSPARDVLAMLASFIRPGSPQDVAHALLSDMRVRGGPGGASSNPSSSSVLDANQAAGLAIWRRDCSSRAVG